ncbi:DUF1330 domain-containing protein [Actinocorallia populi]|uniref:DUF1330 domain-containing protein n=1 Tax=Actinocorallia populi TaxID=2079200 RepID=UPI000D08BE21|nr:DUF1330 domain-containing protein [Actinocorallia populi]
MPKGYVLLTEAIEDPEGMAAYERASVPTLIQGGAAILAVDDSPRLLEGEWHGTRTILLEFPSVEAARAWYESPEYAEAKPLRQAAATSNAVLLTGFEMPS